MKAAGSVLHLWSQPSRSSISWIVHLKELQEVICMLSGSFARTILWLAIKQLREETLFKIRVAFENCTA